MRRRIKLVAAVALLLAVAVMHGPDGGTGRHQTEEKR